MRIWTNKNGDYKFNQHKEGMEPRMIGDFTDILLTNIQQADLPNVSSLSPKSGFMIPGVEQEISHLCLYLWTARTAKNFANVLFTELCLFDLRFQFRKNVYQVILIEFRVVNHLYNVYKSSIEPSIDEFDLLIKTLSGSICHDSISIWWTSKSKLPMITCHSCQLHLP